MMKKHLFIILFSFFISPASLFADEGMWFLMFIERLNGRDMEKLGLQLSAEEIYSVNNNSLKDAIVVFGRGCTASIISNQGLVLTNHHCGYGSIADISTVKDNYLKDGFWARSTEEELKTNGLSVRFFVRMDDVTSRILAKVNDNMSKEEREIAISNEIELIEKENSENGKYIVSVRSFFEGNEFYYFVYQDFKDVRLVGTPPENIGKFGGDTDNWEWPRHTGDFSLFRVYTDKDGNPAEYSPENIPLKPKKFLNISVAGIKEKDFAMILGYPGRTNRWQTSAWVDQKVYYSYPAWVESSKTAMDAMKEFMDKDPAIDLLYSSRYSGIANYWKNRQGMIDALTEHKTAATKRQNELAFSRWARDKKEYSHVLSDIYNYYAKTNRISSDENYLNMIFRASTWARSIRLNTLLDQYVHQKVTREDVQRELDEYFSSFDLETEKKIFADLILLFTKNINDVPMQLIYILSQNPSPEELANKLSTESIYSSRKLMNAFLDNPSVDTLASDPMFVVFSTLYRIGVSLYDKVKDDEDKYVASYRKFIKGMRESGISTIKYPDANSTLRLTYGKVRSLPDDPRNKVSINNYTEENGLLAKYKANDPEFDMPEKLRDMLGKKDFGRYADADGSLHVNFLTDNDITGGNSGSPVMNGKGEIIGLAFDGNIEAMASDVIFDDDMQRTINVDIRYVLWLIDKFSGATNIIDELEIKE